MTLSRFIVFEGVDGCSKSTQVEELVERLLKAGVNAWATKEPWLDSTKEEIEKTNNPLSHLFSYSADRCRHVEKILKMLKHHGWVVCDRYIASMSAIQGTAPGIDKSFVSECIRQSISTPNGLLLPDLTIWLDLPVSEAVRRVEERDGVSVGDDERERMTRAYEAYRQMHQQERVGDISLWLLGKHIVRIDCDGKDQERISEEVWGVVKGLIDG